MPLVKRRSRWCCAAAQVVMQQSYALMQHSVDQPGSADEIAAHIDWESTARVRSALSQRGFTIAEAMDTAQRQYLGWPLAQELIRRTAEQRLECGFVAGASAEQAGSDARATALVDAVVEQGHFIRAQGGEVVLLPLIPLALAQASEATYVDVYTSLARALGAPLILHRLGPMFQPLLRHDFPADSFRRILRENAEFIGGVKYSLLDPAGEVALRRELLPRDQFVLTGDDWNFPELICGSATEVGAVQRTITFGKRTVALGDFSHALLGVLAAISKPVADALPLLEAGNAAEWMRLMQPQQALARVLFEEPVQDYKAGIAFLSWINGWQPNPLLVNHQQRQRTPEHYARLVTLASAARVLGA
ncbi:MAG: DUF993 family protein [Planctomycetes bacterium]|nr:DUF993 family protein [Planctomycetota bacterium]